MELPPSLDSPVTDTVMDIPLTSAFAASLLHPRSNSRNNSPIRSASPISERSRSRSNSALQSRSRSPSPLPSGSTSDIQAVGTESADVECGCLTAKALRDLRDVDIDHVIELQILSCAIDRVFQGQQISRKFIRLIINFFNDVPNLKVRPRTENKEKGKVTNDYVEAFEHDRRFHANPREWKFLKEIKEKWLTLREPFIQIARRTDVDAELMNMVDTKDVVMRFVRAMDEVLHNIRLTNN